MKKSIIWELIKINILYSNPQLLASVKKKQNKKKNASFSAYKSILRQQIFMMIMFAFIYTVFFLGVDYSESVGFFSLQLSIFAIMSIVYGFTGFFSVFYDSKDTKLYLALPLHRTYSSQKSCLHKAWFYLSSCPVFLFYRLPIGK